MRDIWESTAMAPPLASTAEEYWHGKYESDEELLETIKEAAITIWHAAGRYKMGKEEGKEAVMDSAARVFGVEGLRAVNARSFPLLSPGHPSSRINALEEKIAANITAGVQERACCWRRGWLGGAGAQLHMVQFLSL